METKIYTIKTSKSGRTGQTRENQNTGTLAELISCYSYTLEVGASYDKKVNRNPKTIRSFVTSLQRAYEAKEACCYDRTNVELA